MVLVCAKFHEIWNILSGVMEGGAHAPPPRGMTRPKRHGADRVKQFKGSKLKNYSSFHPLALHACRSIDRLAVSFKNQHC